MVRKRQSRGVLGPAAAVALSLGAITNVATADHYHINCNNHGLVHGSSTADSNYHARVEGTPCRGAAYCTVGQWGNPLFDGYVPGNGTTCNVHAVGYGPECAGTADVEAFYANGAFVLHRHYAHSRC